MQNHQQRPRVQSPTAGKPPRPPPLSVSIPSNLDPPTQPEPETHSDELSSSPSPLRSESPLRSDNPVGVGAIVAVDKYYSPLTSPIAVTPPKDSTTPDSYPPHHIISFNRREEAPPHTGAVYGGGGGGGGGGGEERKRRVGFVTPTKKEGLLNKVALGVRVLEIVFCLISFSVMASDKTQGWSGDSFDRYKEYRFCLAVNVIGFVYSGFQTYDLAYHLATGKHVITHHLRCQFDFIVDQILAYLLMSASSAAAARVTDWQANWGKDEFTEKVSASVSMSFFAFVAFAVSSLISGYNLCNPNL